MEIMYGSKTLTARNNKPYTIKTIVNQEIVTKYTNFTSLIHNLLFDLLSMIIEEKADK